MATHASASDAAQNKRPARQEQSPGEQHCERCRIFLPDVCRISGKPLWMYNNQHCITNARYMCGLPSVFDQGIKQYFTSWVPQQLPLGWRGGLIPSLSDAKGTPFERLKHQGESRALSGHPGISRLCDGTLHPTHLSCRNPSLPYPASEKDAQVPLGRHYSNASVTALRTPPPSRPPPPSSSPVSPAALRVITAMAGTAPQDRLWRTQVETHMTLLTELTMHHSMSMHYGTNCHRRHHLISSLTGAAL